MITGEETAVAAAGEALQSGQAPDVIPLKSVAHFFTELPQRRRGKLGQELEKVEIQSFTVPYVTM